MRISQIWRAVFAVALGFAAGLGILSPGYAQDKNVSHVVSYIEAKPSTRAQAVALLRSLRDAGRKEAGNAGFEILQRIDYPHFVVLEVWKDAKAQADHDAAATTRQIRDKLSPLLVAPYDQRVNFAFALGPDKKPAARSIYAVTHVDFVGAKKDVGLAAIKPLSTESAGERGVERYDVLQQTAKPNHITLVEVWRGKSALEAHMQTAAFRKFREDLLPIGGALYDQRLYRLVK